MNFVPTMWQGRKIIFEILKKENISEEHRQLSYVNIVWNMIFLKTDYKN